VIRSFKDAEAENILNRVHSRRFASIERVILRKLRSLHRATEIGDLMNPPGNRLEALKGNRAGQHRIRINDQWRICFRWEKGDAYEVEIVDYH
jgi:proteic killer suppression protein